MALHRYGDFRVEVFYFDSPCRVGIAHPSPCVEPPLHATSFTAAIHKKKYFLNKLIIIAIQSSLMHFKYPTPFFILCWIYIYYEIVHVKNIKFVAIRCFLSTLNAPKPTDIYRQLILAKPRLLAILHYYQKRLNSNVKNIQITRLALWHDMV